MLCNNDEKKAHAHEESLKSPKTFYIQKSFFGGIEFRGTDTIQRVTVKNDGERSNRAAESSEDGSHGYRVEFLGDIKWARPKSTRDGEEGAGLSGGVGYYRRFHNSYTAVIDFRFLHGSSDRPFFTSEEKKTALLAELKLRRS